MLPQFNSIGEFIQAQSNILPQSATAAQVIKGAALLRMGDGIQFGSCVMAARIGAAAGTPSGVTVTIKIQTSPDTTDGDFVDYVDEFGNGSGAGALVLDAASSAGHLNVDLAGANLYVRLVITMDLVGGSSPTAPVSGEIVLGGISQTAPVPSYS